MRFTASLPGLAAIIVLAAAPGEIRPTVAMRAARMAHTATTLADGSVLVAGGFTDPGAAARSAELYDPVDDRFGALPRLTVLRHSHTATLLADGRVLLAGGYTEGNTVTAAAELFDPATRRFQPTGAMRAARAGHVAIPLADGTVLIAGGVGPDWQFLASAELFDPATGTFTPTGAMSVPRESHAAVALRDGRVLIIGGHRGRRDAIVLYASAEAYDPRRRTFTAVGGMQVRRHKHDAALLADGRVLVTGGSDERDNRGAYTSTELFDPRTDAFVMGPAMLRARYKHNGSTILLPDGRLLVAGGADQAEVFNPVRGRFELVPGATTLTGQFSAAATLGSRGALITGGYGHGRGPQATAWRYRP